MCKCGLGHRGWEENLCRIELFNRSEGAKTPVTTASAPKIKTILGHPSDPVLVGSGESGVITGNMPGNATKQRKQILGVSGNAKRQASLKSSRVASGLMRWELWTHPDDMEAIKKFAKELAEKRC